MRADEQLELYEPWSLKAFRGIVQLKTLWSLDRLFLINAQGAPRAISIALYRVLYP
jgi:hypothetical protein